MEALVGSLQHHVDICKARWKSLRDAFVKNRNKSLPSGSAGGTQKGWKYTDLMSFLLPYVQQRSSKSSLSNPSPVEDMERASTPLSLETEEHARTACGSPAPPPTAPPPLVPTTSAERQRPSRSRSPRDPISTPAAAQRSTRDTRRRPQSTDLGEQLISLLQEPPTAPHMPDSEGGVILLCSQSCAHVAKTGQRQKHQAQICILNTFHNLERDTQHQQHWQPIDHPPATQHSIHTSRPVAFQPSVPQPPRAQSTPTRPSDMLSSSSSSAWQESFYEQL
ncbi:hypothetical protein KUCAC02_013103 [Chaenocephalus aceratus]|uniref:Uncharacterized protein n=1 Tax=Chaenocephalus aceratus TaxID=36190 RepID=A0ACB9XER9_CHAAC|nr:hypothetical protein KUCAC02_013103 [Chaenocephalus aceratus]